jgi:hypothetical protein
MTVVVMVVMIRFVHATMLRQVDDRGHPQPGRRRPRPLV